jgi:hypothetical protein
LASSLIPSLSTDVIEIAVALALEQIAEGDSVSGLAVVERVHGHGILQDPRRGEILARMHEARSLARDPRPPKVMHWIA